MMMMQQSTLFEQPPMGPGLMLAAPNHDLTAASLDVLMPQQLSGGNAPHNVHGWESYPNMFQSTSDSAARPRKTPGPVAALNTSPRFSAPSTSKAGAGRRVSKVRATGTASARSAEKPDTKPNLAGANSSFDSAVPSGKTGQKRKATRRKRTIIKQEEEEEEEEGEEEEPEVPPSKRNKFLERNRVAASKCREKKKVWLHDLEETKHELEMRHRGLRMEYESLMEEVTRIKNSLVNHACCSDPQIDTWIRNEAHNFVKRSAERAATSFDSSSSMSPPAHGWMSRGSHSSGHGGRPEMRAINYDHMPDDLPDQ
ncbi:Cyclic AMP-dependent transcription factor ATF-2 [Paramyrothecium foliicola]|nr:Cyclic AMP-dependent transcription factor ATF-2 [Paramyrothecium foliicola]